MNFEKFMGNKGILTNYNFYIVQGARNQISNLMNLVDIPLVQFCWNDFSTDFENSFFVA